MNHTPRLRGPVVALAAITLAVLSIVSPVAPAAHAHDQVLSTSPAADEHLEVAPTRVTMTFTDDILDVGAIVQVVDAQGTNRATGMLALDRASATQPLTPGLADGAYQVRWRVVSADGHPVAGTFDFSVGTVPVGSSSAGPAGEFAAPAATDAGHAEASPGANGGLPLLVVALLGACGGIAILALVLVLRGFWRRRRAT